MNPELAALLAEIVNKWQHRSLAPYTGEFERGQNAAFHQAAQELQRIESIAGDSCGVTDADLSGALLDWGKDGKPVSESVIFIFGWKACIAAMNAAQPKGG